MPKSSVKFVAELPPKATGRQGDGGPPQWVKDLQAQPGEWAIVPLKRSGSATALKYGIEIVTRTVDGERVVLGRFVGES